MRLKQYKPIPHVGVLWYILGLFIIGLLISQTGLAVQPGIPNNTVVTQNIKPQYTDLALPVYAVARQDRIFITWMAKDEYKEGYYIYRTDKVTNQPPIKLNDIDPELKATNPNLKSKPVLKRNSLNVTGCFTAEEKQDILTVLQITAPEQFFAPNMKDPNNPQKVKLDRDKLRGVLQQLYAGAARAMGVGYLDKINLTGGRTYTYQVVPVINGKESPINSGTITIACQDSTAGITLPNQNDCMIYQGDQSIELLWPKNDTILAYDVYRLPASANPNLRGERLNSFASAMVTYVPNNAPTGYIDHPIIKVHPTMKPVPITTGKPQIKLDPNKTDNSLVNMLDRKPMAFYIDNTIISNPIPPKNPPTPTPPPMQNYQVVHEVKNGESYVYRIVPRDILGQFTDPTKYIRLQATPHDLIKPGVPGSLKFEVIHRQWVVPASTPKPGCCASDTCSLCKPNWLYPKPGTVYDQINGGFSISWSPVTLNEEGNPEKVASYTLWRYNSEADAGSNNDPGKRTLIGTCPVDNAVINQPNQQSQINTAQGKNNNISVDPNKLTQINNQGNSNTILNDPQKMNQITTLQSNQDKFTNKQLGKNYSILTLTDKTAKSETMYWYRVEVIDKANHSNFSGVFSAYYPDNLAPLAPANVTSPNANLTGITILWDPSKDADNPGINATDVLEYRIYRRVCGTVPVAKKQSVLGVSGGNKPTDDDVKNGTYQDFFMPIHTVPANPNSATYSYTDQSLPADSPYCYEYCVKAVDKSQNISLNTTGNVACNRLTKQKGPRAATITSLQARSNSIRIDWAAPPSVDLYTFRVYRSEQADHKDWKPVTFDPQFTELHCEDTPPTPPDFCAGIDKQDTTKPLIYKGSMVNTYYFIDDQGVKPNQKYWYQIVSYDFLQNPKDDSQYLKNSTSVMMSSFTYDKFITGNLTIQQPSYLPLKGVTLNWTPPSGVSGITYLVYRSSKSANDGFMPLAASLPGNTYVDITARPGVTYWYKVQYVSASGHYSEFSNIVSLVIPE